MLAKIAPERHTRERRLRSPNERALREMGARSAPAVQPRRPHLDAADAGGSTHFLRGLMARSFAILLMGPTGSGKTRPRGNACRSVSTRD